jgi:hypothetical protein
VLESVQSVCSGDNVCLGKKATKNEEGLDTHLTNATTHGVYLTAKNVEKKHPTTNAKYGDYSKIHNAKTYFLVILEIFIHFLSKSYMTFSLYFVCFGGFLYSSCYMLNPIIENIRKSSGKIEEVLYSS